ncbi:MAG TPA: SRPBCC domain-containing protein, partial [Rhodothermales bacterium]
TTKARDKTVRGTWANGPTRIDVYFLPRKDDRVQVTVTHSRLADAEAAASMKHFWADALERLRSHLE